MRHQTYRILASAAFAAVLGFGSSFAHAQDIAAELESLKSRIAELEARQARERGAAQQARAVDAAIVDADKKAASSASSFTGGWDKAFKIQSADGAFLLSPIVQLQFRNTTNYTAGDVDSGDDTVNGFEFRRARLGFKGNAFSKDLTYEIRLSVDRASGEAILDNAYLQYQFADDFAFKFGQFKLNWTREETSSSARLLAAERSLLNAILGGGNTNYVQGVGLIYNPKDGPFRGDVQFTDGDNTANTNYTDTNASGYQNFGVAVRGEYKVAGEWDAYNDFTALKTGEDLVVLGGGVDWAQGGDGDAYRFTADAQFENAAGVGLYGAAIYTIAEGDTSEIVLDQSVGGLAQVAYLLPNFQDWEVFGRYSIFVLDEDVNGEDNFHEATVGVNKYFHGHNAKFTLDVGYLPNGSPSSASGLGVTNSTEEQIVLRGQFQLAL